MALVLPLLLLFIGGVVDLGRALYTKVIVTNAAREGARAAIFATSIPGPTARAETAVGNQDWVDAGKIDVDVTACPASPAPADNATVVVTFTGFDWMILGPALALFNGGSPPNPDLSGTAVMKCGG